jgi:hypothetical protein
LGQSATTFVHAVQSGTVLGATAAILDAPAAMVNGFLNGQTTLPLSITALGLPTTLDIPLDGIRVPATQYTATVAGLSGFPVFVTGTPVGGILSDILTDIPATWRQHWAARRLPLFRFLRSLGAVFARASARPSRRMPGRLRSRISLQRNIYSRSSSTFG